MENSTYIDDNGNPPKNKNKLSDGVPHWKFQLETPSNFKAKIWPQIIASLAGRKDFKPLRRLYFEFSYEYQCKIGKGKFVNLFGSNNGLANSGAFAFGIVLGWPSSAMPKLIEDGDFDDISDSDYSWISSIVTLGACIANIPVGVAVDWIGSRNVMLCLSLPFLVGWVLLCFAKTFSMILAGRFITGICGGAYFLTAPIFIAETSKSKIRGMLISGFELMKCIGVLFILKVGQDLSWRNQSFVCAFIPILCFTMMYFMPKSPRYLVFKNMEGEACKSLMWLRGAKHEEQVQKELQELMENVSGGKSEGNKFKALLDPLVLKAALLIFVLFFFQIMAGVNVAVFYIAEIFSAAGLDVDSYDANVIINSVQIVAVIGVALTVHLFGRRNLLIGSEIVLAISLTGLGAFFCLNESRDTLGWLGLLSFILFVAGYSAGLGPIPYILMPEILPQNVRGIACGILLTLKWGIEFLMRRYFFGDLINALDYHGALWFFGGICLMGAIFVFFFIPETKGKSLEEIQGDFTKK